MLHILMGDSTGDPISLFSSIDGKNKIDWIVPKTALTNEEAVFYLPKWGFVAYGSLSSNPSQTDRPGWFTAPIKHLRLLPSFVPLAFIRSNHPNWRWATYPRSYTTIKDSIESRFRELLEGFQKVFTQAENELSEGKIDSLLITRYERNPLARQLCIQHYGTSCTVCEFSFGDYYGEEFENYIHVHHIKPISSRGGQYRIDPIRDLRPICPSCHAVIHSKTPPLSITSLRKIIKSAQS